MPVALPAPSNALRGSYVLSLRPVGGHAGLRRAAARHGARLIALSPWRIERLVDAETRTNLDAALRADAVVCTSPAAVVAAHALAPGLGAHRNDGRPMSPGWFAIGAGTAAALRRAGIADAQSPERMDSGGLLALPGLQQLRGRDVGLVTGRGGRDLVAPALRERGARVLRADVYARMAHAPMARAVNALRTLEAPAWLALSSGDALLQLLAQLPDDARQALRRARVVAASARLAQLAREQGFADIVLAESARPAALLAAAARAALA